MKQSKLFSFLTWAAVSVARPAAQHVLSTSIPKTQATTTIPFFLPIPGTVDKAGGNITVTANSDGTLRVSARTQLFNRAPSKWDRSWTFTPHPAPGDSHMERPVPHSCDLMGSIITTAAGTVVPVVIPIPDSSSSAKGNVTIGVQLDGKVHIDTSLSATLEAGDRISSKATDSIGVVISALGGFRTEGCSEDEVCMLPEVEIQIQEEDIDVRINGVDGSTAVDIFF